MGLPRWLVVKNPFANAGDIKQFDSWVGKIPWRRKWHPTPVFLPGESRGQRSLPVCSPWGGKELGTTEHARFIQINIKEQLACSRYTVKAGAVEEPGLQNVAPLSLLSSQRAAVEASGVQDLGATCAHTMQGVDRHLPSPAWSTRGRREGQGSSGLESQPHPHRPTLLSPQSEY